MDYRLAIQQTKTKQYRVLVISEKNGKLVMSGEALKRKVDAKKLLKGLETAWKNVVINTMILPANFKWPGNKGPKKKPISKRDPLAKAFDETASWRPTAVKSAKKKAAPKKTSLEWAAEQSKWLDKQKKSAKKKAPRRITDTKVVVHEWLLGKSAKSANKAAKKKK